MGKGRAPTSFEYYLMNKNEKKRKEKKSKNYIVPDEENRFNIDGHTYYKSGLSGKYIKLK